MSMLGNAYKKITKAFSGGNVTFNREGNVESSRKVTSQLAEYLINKSRFDSMTDEEIYEALYVDEAEIGSAIDKFSTMVAQAYQYFTYDKTKKLKDLPDSLLMTTDFDESLAEEMVNAANQMAKNLKLKSAFEIYSEIIETQGQVFIEIEDDLNLNILPNCDVTIVDDLRRIDGSYPDANIKMTKANFLVLQEGTEYQRTIPKDKFYIIRFKETPTHCLDSKGRQTFGLYAVSPLQRAVIPVWQKRQIMIIDILWRWSNVPRDHHKLDMEMFTLDKFPGTKEEKQIAAQRAVNSMIAAYASALESKVPDQGYVTTSAVDILPIEHSSSNYMSPNEAISQLTDQLWGALGVPKSIVTGASGNSYASELIISNYTAVKIISVANTIADIILDNIRRRLLLLNKKYPVDLLEAKMKFELANSRLERYRQMAIMASLGCYTEDEVRAVDDSPPLAADQRQFILNAEPANIGGGTGMGKSAQSIGPKSDAYRQTPHSDSQHATDIGQARVNKTQKNVPTNQ